MIRHGISVPVSICLLTLTRRKSGLEGGVGLRFMIGVKAQEFFHQKLWVAWSGKHLLRLGYAPTLMLMERFIQLLILNHSLRGQFRVTIQRSEVAGSLNQSLDIRLQQ